MRLAYRYINTLLLISLSIVLLLSCNNLSNKKQNEKQEVTVFAAASLTNVLHEIVDSFEVKYQASVKLNLASSGALARQIQLGASADVYLSANTQWANYIDSLGFVKQNLIQEIANNSLVLIAPKNSDIQLFKTDILLDLPVLIGEGYLSMGDPNHVPAGKYSKQALENYNLYSKVSHRILPTKDVRTALMVVEMNEAPLGIVFSTDAKSSEKVKVVGNFSISSHKPINYVAAVCSNNKTALLFYNFLNSEETLPIWIKFGFIK